MRRLFAHLVLGIVPLLLASPLRAQEATPAGYTAVATPDKVALGERFLYRIEIRDLPEISYILPDGAALGEAFEPIASTTQRLDPTVPGEVTTRIDMALALFALGEHPIADLTLLATTPQGARTLVIPGPRVTGIEHAPQGSPFAQALPPVEFRVPDYSILFWIGGGLALLAIVLLLVRALSRRPERGAPPAPAPTPPHERALAALDALEREALFDRGRTREHWFRLSEIVRSFLGERYAFNAIDLTTEELLRASLPFEAQGLDRRRLTHFCQEADLAKFAKAEPDRDTSIHGLAEARAFVAASRAP